MIAIFARDDPHLIEAVEKLGKKANGRFADLHVVEIPDDVEWDIEEYDGNEWIAEKHRTW
jgi:cytosine/adenosine deaminase-related metal-dependent hydrolase